MFLAGIVSKIRTSILVASLEATLGSVIAAGNGERVNNRETVAGSNKVF